MHERRLRSGIAWLALVAVACLGLYGCGTVSKGVAADGKSAQQLVFPDPSDAMVKGGTFPNIENLRAVAPGMTKLQLYTMFGPPHFHEGVWRVHEWDYLFNFRVRNGEHPFVTCEYKVLFDHQDIAQSFYWKPASCAELIEESPRQVAAAPVSPTSPRVQRFEFSTDALFGFDAARLTPVGRHQLDSMLRRIRRHGAVDVMQVVGYTDRIGTFRYNLDLSRKRAQSVRAYLVREGIPGSVIHAQGWGERDPLVTCTDTDHALLVRCLAPNRRVEVMAEVTQQQGPP
ncbi:OmpA family protein [Oleiagrimonas sp. MCCC 1A03011]|uniref:OmpA family protein n=1 Tax=Oleiagrimonas sp. MCCC 1A03011 TaxID=1926883 RepID=UPI000DC383E7|nr:OmpA family protein [Oleiagrimonas sp. MCCC 1A03011]RAP59746.1 hypothetical protein BTJ49_00290 [Oleiagrimonas sp. MCCC 1A03011]